MIHWCGTGLSAIPGLRRLIENGHDVTVWNRTVEKARAAVGDLTDRIERYDEDALSARLAAGDVVISMLPADRHVPLAKICIDARAHFVSSSYISPQMAGLHDAALEAGVALVNEVGLDPGIDHLMAHDLIARYRASEAFDKRNDLSFLSYCGGVPKTPNDFRYKFSWSPLGVLRALRSPSSSIRDFTELDAARPWVALSTYEAPLPEPETFEVYPNRNSLPFMEQYDFDPGWRVRDFVRGTLRLEGWSEAWAPVFKEIDDLKGAAGEARLVEMADEMWSQHAYAEGEADRVVLVVDLSAEHDYDTVWHETWVLDAQGDERGSAMARLVSIPVALAVEAAQAGKLPAGVQAAPSDPAIVAEWLDRIAGEAQHMARVDRSGEVPA